MGGTTGLSGEIAAAGNAVSTGASLPGMRWSNGAAAGKEWCIFWLCELPVVQGDLWKRWPDSENTKGLESESTITDCFLLMGLSACPWYSEGAAPHGCRACMACALVILVTVRQIIF